MPKTSPTSVARSVAGVLLVLSAVDLWFGSQVDGAVFGRIWRGTMLLEIAWMLVVAAGCLAFRLRIRGAGLAGVALISVLIFGGAQHFARSARRQAMATGAIPPGVQAITADELRARFSLCFEGGSDEFHELELGILPASPTETRPRWLLTQAYAPMSGVPRGFGIARAYLTLKASNETDRAQKFSSAIASLGLSPQPFLEAVVRESMKLASSATQVARVAPRPTLEPIQPTEELLTPPRVVERVAPDNVAGPLEIPERSNSVLSYPAHEVPELDDGALQHPGAIVIDPATLRSMSYGWEWVWMSKNHPRIGLHTREGAGDLEGQQEGVGDFHGLHRNDERSEVVYDFKVERPGYYSLHAMILPEATKCSNYPQAALDDGVYADLGHNGCEPFEWYSADWRGGAVALGKGWHQLHLHFMQDGLTLAQFWLSHEGGSGGDRGPAVVPERPPLNLLLTRRSMGILKDETADFGAWVQNFGKLNSPASLDAELDPGRGRALVKVHRDIQLDPNAAIQEFPIALTVPANLPAREMRVTVTLTTRGGEQKVVRESTVVKPFPAEFLGPIERPHDKDLSITDAEYLSPKSGTTPQGLAWKPFPSDAISYYGLYDLNRAFGGGAYEGIFFSRAYVAVKLDVPKDGDYLFKIMGDDVVMVWIDGKHIYSSQRKGPPIRYPGTSQQHLTAGEHLMVMHCDQTTGWWQCGVHLRTADDDVCDIEGKDN